MRSNKGKNTSPEISMRKALRDNGASGYRLHWKVPGKPDIAYPGRKIAIFVNGCFWHRCPRCDLPLPKSNTGFWTGKFERNVARDVETQILRV
jgi:DNA mismatch endonuclease (patch repair protein)